jgi:integrase
MKLPQYVIAKPGTNNLYVSVQVPKDVRGLVGKAKLTKALGTDSPLMAARMAPSIVAEFKGLIDLARSNPNTDLDQLRKEIQLAQVSLPETLERVINGRTYTISRDDLIEDMAFDAFGGGTKNQREALSVTFGSGILLAEHYDNWSATLDLKPKTVTHYKVIVSAFLKGFRMASDVTTKSVTQWAKVEWPTKTKKALGRDAGALRSFWKYVSLHSEGDKNALGDPFTGMADIGTTNTRELRAYTKQEYAAMLKLADDDLRDVITILAHSGLRVEELCQLKTSDVADMVFVVKQSKTKAGQRVVPVHQDIAQIVARLLDTSKDGYLIPSRSLNQYDQRQAYYSKKFRLVLTALGFPSGFGFHELRKLFITEAERSKVHDNSLKRMVGHSIPGLTFSLYSDGLEIDDLRQEINKVRMAVTTKTKGPAT